MGFFETQEDFLNEGGQKISRDNIVINSASVDAMKKLVDAAKSVGYDTTIMIADDKLRINFDNTLASIDCGDFACGTDIDVPTGAEVAEDVDDFRKAYNPKEEITRKQKSILATNTPLTADTVKSIENQVTKTQNSIIDLQNKLTALSASQKVQTLSPELKKETQPAKIENSPDPRAM